jgi:hypothetical protein
MVEWIRINVYLSFNFLVAFQQAPRLVLSDLGVQK